MAWKVSAATLLMAAAGFALADRDDDEDDRRVRATWDPAQVSVVGAPGTSQTINVILKDAGTLPDTDDVNLIVEGAAAPYIQIKQSVLPRKIKRKADLTIPVAIVIAADAPSGASSAEVVLKRVEKKKARLIKNAAALQITVVVNRPPVADAGPAQQVFRDSGVLLDGSKSRDPEGAGLTYQWKLASVPAGSIAVLGNANSARPQFVADKAGTYVASLIVNDGYLASAPASVQITAVLSPAQFIQSLEDGGEYPILDRSHDVRGPDVDANGIRDDIFVHLAKLPITANQRPSVEQFARSLQAAMLIDTTNESAVRGAIDAIARAVNCLETAFPDPKQHGALVNTIEKFTANTQERAVQYVQFSNSLSGSVLKLPSGNTCDQ